MNKLTTEELLELRNRLYKIWLLAPVVTDGPLDHASCLMDDIDNELKARNAWVDYEADYEYAKGLDT
jgi:hypothetical protein